MPKDKINLRFEVVAPRADLIEETATGIALATLGEDYTIEKLDFDDIDHVAGTPTSGPTALWESRVRVVAKVVRPSP